MSGQGNGAKRNNDDDSFDSIDKTNAKGASKEHSLKVHSSEIFDFCVIDPIAHCLQDCLKINHLLESFSSEMPEDPSGRLSHRNLSGCGTPSPKH